MPETETTLTLIGGPTVLIDVGGVRLLTDPTFDRPGSYAPARPGAVLLTKTAGPALGADEIGRVDAVLLSHDQHADNLDRAGRAFLSRAGVTFTTEAGAKRLGGNAVALAPFETTQLTGANGRTLFITAAPARHGPVGIEPISGDVVGFLVGIGAPGDAVYVTGDTVWYEGTAEVARLFSPKLVIAFAGAAQPRGTFHMTMTSNDVIATAHAFPQARIAAVHTDGWAHFKESVADLAAAFSALNLSERLLTLEPARPVAAHPV